MLPQAILVLVLQRGIKRSVQALGNATGADPIKTQKVAKALSIGTSVLLSVAMLDPISLTSIGEGALTGRLS